MRGNTTIVLFKRRISNANVLRAMTIFSVTLLLTACIATVIYLTLDNASFTDVMFEAVTAIATVGLSAIGTPTLGSLPHILLMLLMFFGRVGILTVTYSIMERLHGESNIIKYPEAQILIG